MAAIKNIPVVNIHVENLVESWPALTLAIRSSTFAALDLEMSGIGSRKDTMTRSTEDRYKAFCEIAKTRSVLSLGVSLFQENKAKGNVEINKKGNKQFTVQTFNIMVISKAAFTVEPNSLKFLVEHGFDFNKHYAKAIPYNRNHTQKKEENSSYTIRNVFLEILRASKPVVLHNGVLDLVFLYQNFYTDLPSTSLTFLADVAEMFPAGVFDTKYIAEYHTDYPATFLNYVFRKNWRRNMKDEAETKSCVIIESYKYPSDVDVCYNNLIYTKSTSEDYFPCEQYAAHGHCRNGTKCEMSHDIDIILDSEWEKTEKKRKRKRKRKRKGSTHLSNENCGEETHAESENGDSAELQDSRDHQEVPPLDDKPVSMGTGDNASGNHRAGFDAFMTGFSMAAFLHRFGKNPELTLAENLPDFVNKLNLSGKDVPLKITKSQYTKTSNAHKDMWQKVMSR